MDGGRFEGSEAHRGQAVRVLNNPVNKRILCGASMQLARPALDPRSENLSFAVAFVIFEENRVTF